MKSVRERSQKQEKLVAKELSAKTVLASGAVWCFKGDVRNSRVLVECKTTKKDIYRVKSSVWDKIREEAVKDHMRIPLLVVDLQDSERYVIFESGMFDKEPPDAIPCLTTGTLHDRSFNLFKGVEKLVEKFPYKMYVYGKHDRRYALTVWTMKEFLDYYKEELS